MIIMHELVCSCTSLIVIVDFCFWCIFCFMMSLFFFFFKQKTAYEMRISDWSSDVCSSDLSRRSAGVRTGGSGARATGRRVRQTARDVPRPFCQCDPFSRRGASDRKSVV